MSNQIHQMNVTYSAAEDRLLLRVSTTQEEEFRIWLTRRFVKLLLGVLVKEIDKRGGMPKVAANEETVSMLEQGAMKKQYEVKQEVSYPFGEDGILAAKINITSRENDSLDLEILPEQGRGLTFSFNQSLLFMFYSMISQAINQSDLGIVDNEMLSMQLH
ncbi:MAG: hypothetical protein ACR2P9_04120 [Gammaproteobacteria bacterium]